MTRTQRVGLLALALVVAVGAFVVLGTGDDDETATGPVGAETAPTETPTATAPSAPEPPEPVVPRIRVRDGAPVGGVREIKAVKGDTVRILVTVDAPDEIHLHGYDIRREPEPGKPARFRFKADIEGVFDIESHEAEHAGRDPLVAKLVVEP
jgi:FtsP/CotA-like multicopper oxidase with cupredoxin domain